MDEPSASRFAELETFLKGADGRSMTVEHVIPPLLVAAQQGNLATVKSLISRGADINATTKDGWTALKFAVSEDHEDVVSYLVQQGANMDGALLQAVIFQRFHIAQLLIQNGAVPTMDCLVKATSGFGTMEIAKLLLENISIMI